MLSATDGSTPASPPTGVVEAHDDGHGSDVMLDISELVWESPGWRGTAVTQPA
jgi:hypothetical protein